MAHTSTGNLLTSPWGGAAHPSVKNHWFSLMQVVGFTIENAFKYKAKRFGMLLDSVPALHFIFRNKAGPYNLGFKAKILLPKIIFNKQ